MLLLKYFKVLLLLYFTFQQTVQQTCKKDVKKVRQEERQCGISCSPSLPCGNPRARCRCDGACGFVCISPDHHCVPDPIKYGSIFGESYSFLSSIIYSCDEGFELIGPEIRTCRSDSRWSGEKPFCAKTDVLCGPPEFEFQFENAILNTTPIKEEYTEGDRLSYQCKVGFTHAKGDVLDTKCVVIEGVALWTLIEISCSSVTCKTPDDVPNGKVIFTPPLKYLSNVSYECDDGFLLTGDKFRQCNEIGEWNGTRPTCSKADCGKPEAPANGKVVSFEGSTINDRVDYECGPHSTTNNVTMSAVCTLVNNTAKWSSPPPICLRNCKVIEFQNAFIRQIWPNMNFGSFVRHNTAVVFQCNVGFEIPSLALASEKVVVVKCEDGFWSGSITCKPARCLKTSIEEWHLDERNLQLPNNMPGAIDSGTNISIDCHINYPEKNEDIFLLCNHGSWIYPFQRCTKRSCDIRDMSTPFIIISIEVNVIPRNQTNKIIHGTQLTIECLDKDYVLYRNNTIAQTIADRSIKCEDGKLMTANFDCRGLNPLSSCRAMNYSNLDIFENGRLLESKKKYFGTATSLVFRCNDQQEQKLIGFNKIQCYNGIWFPSWPSCQNIVINDRQSPPPVTILSVHERLENGDYLVKRGVEEINFICVYFYAKPIMIINGKEVTNDRNTEIEYSSFHGWNVWMMPVDTVSMYTFTCYIPSNEKFVVFEKYSNSLTVRVGDSCELSENDEIKRHQNAVFLNSTLRPLYAEGDEVLFGCEKLGVDVLLPFAIKCGRDGVWDIIREPHISCL